MDLNNKIAIVTGASKSIGRSIAINLARHGATLAINYGSDDDAAKAVLDEIGGNSILIKSDVSDQKSVESMTEKVLKAFGRIDILVNNAGINRDKFLMLMTEDDWKKVIDVNLTGTFNCCKAVCKQMISQKYGKIVNISSTSAISGIAGQTNYSASKAAIIGFSKSLSRELAPFGINVNTVAPGLIDSEMVEKIPEYIRGRYLEHIPAKRFGTCDEVANVVLFLTSDKANYINGQTIIVDGGLT